MYINYDEAYESFIFIHLPIYICVGGVDFDSVSTIWLFDLRIVSIACMCVLILFL